jgi:hypothetical protein
MVSGGESRIKSLFQSNKMLRLAAALSVTYKYIRRHDKALPNLTHSAYLREVRPLSPVPPINPSSNLMPFLLMWLSGSIWDG